MKQKKQILYISKKEKLYRLLWDFCWLFLFRPTPRWTLNSWRIFLLRLFGAEIPYSSRVLPSCRIWAPWNLTVGDRTVLGDFANIYSMAKINIGSSVSISQGTFLCCGSHDISSLSLPLIAAPIRIENHVWICADSMIAPGVTISEGSVIAARSNVIDDVAPWVVSGGNPSKQLRIRKIKDS